MIHNTEIDGSPVDYYSHRHLVIDESNADIFRGGWMGSGGFYARPFKIQAGDKKPGHEHYIDHLGMLLDGRAILRWRAPDNSKSGVIDIRVPLVMFHIRADYWHEIEAITTVDWMCLFSKAEADRIYGKDTDVRWIMEKSE